MIFNKRWMYNTLNSVIKNKKKFYYINTVLNNSLISVLWSYIRIPYKFIFFTFIFFLKPLLKI